MWKSSLPLPSCNEVEDMAVRFREVSQVHLDPATTSTAKPIQGGSTPSLTFISLLLYLPSKDVKYNDNYKHLIPQIVQ